MTGEGQRLQVTLDPALIGQRFSTLLGTMEQAIIHGRIHDHTGRIARISGPLIRASLPDARIGELCALRSGPDDTDPVMAEIIGIDGPHALLSAIGDVDGLSTATEVARRAGGIPVPVGERVIGRVLDALGRPVDGRPLEPGESAPLRHAAPDLMSRRMIDQPLAIGLHAIDAFLTCGEGQRVGIFGSAGTGKSSLLAAIVKQSEADVVVVALIGERGREVREFVELQLGAAGIERSVLVCATSERSPLERVKAGHTATTIAEHFRDRGQKVLLLFDSVTRYARALREIGLARGEPPARQGYPPSVFASLPALFERAGCSERGSITAFYTVLVEDDETADPIAEEVRSLLDGHLILSRKLASQGQYPAIDVLQSTSRVMRRIVSEDHDGAARFIRQLLSAYNDNEILIRLGEYQPGADALLDEAVDKFDDIQAFLRDSGDFGTMLDRLFALAAPSVGDVRPDDPGDDDPGDEDAGDGENHSRQEMEA
ncbi:MAG: FliI/YscN family ATPase [Geminicoccaceae bacterium]|nr:FliI/YscN family ATPase [Geminicoccaceae bacterium]